MDSGVMMGDGSSESIPLRRTPNAHCAPRPACPMLHHRAALPHKAASSGCRGAPVGAWAAEMSPLLVLSRFGKFKKG